MNCPFGMQESGTGFLNKYASSVGKLHCSSFVATKKTKSMGVFQFRQLLAQCWLRNVQPVGRPGEAQFLGQDDHCPQMPYFQVREHCYKTPLSGRRLIVFDGRAAGQGKCPRVRQRELLFTPTKLRFAMMENILDLRPLQHLLPAQILKEQKSNCRNSVRVSRDRPADTGCTGSTKRGRSRYGLWLATATSRRSDCDHPVLFLRKSVGNYF